MVTYGAGEISNAHSGKIGIAENFNPVKNDGANTAFVALRNSDGLSLLKHSGSILNMFRMIFSLENWRPNC